MKKIHSIQDYDFEKVPVDEFWNTGSQIEQKMHRIHSYPAKFPSFITTKALQYWKTEKKKKPRRIADIFCGCGTTAFEAKKNAIKFWGCDINPVATLIAKTKSMKYEPKRLTFYFDDILQHYNRSDFMSNFSRAPDRIQYWYSEDQYIQLCNLKNSILSVVPNKSKYKLFFLCAFSNILKCTSKWLTKSIKPQVDPLKTPTNVLDAFSRQYREMFLANEENECCSEAESEIITGDFLDDIWEIPKIDMIITSPPYVTSYEYADLHQLSSLWLDFADDYRELRNGSIGSHHHDYNFNRELKRLNQTGTKIVTRLLDRYKSKAKSIAKYYLDMQQVAVKSYDILNRKGMALFVIGNTEYKGVRIDNAKHLAESMMNAGFSDVSVTKRKISNKILTPFRDSLGMFTTNSSGRKVYSEEFILVGRKF